MSAAAAIPRVNVAVNAACFALLAWLYGGDVADVIRANGNEVAAMSTLPSLPFALVLLLLAFAGGALTAFGVRKRLDGAWRGYRVMPIIAVVGLFLDLFLVSANKTPFSSAARAAASIEVFEHKAAELSGAATVSADTAALEKLLEELGEPPWLVNAQPLPKWSLQTFEGCQGPRLERGEARAGTMFYCVAGDRSQAWITAVGLPLGERFGPPQLVSAAGQPMVGVVQRRAAEVDPQAVRPRAQAPQLSQTLPMYFDADAGNLAPVP